MLKNSKTVLLCRPAIAAAGQAAARQKRAGGGGGGGGGDRQEARVVRLGKENAYPGKENAVASGPNTPSGSVDRRHAAVQVRAIVGLAHRGGAKKGRRRRATGPHGALTTARRAPLPRPRPAAAPRLPRGPGGCQPGNGQAQVGRAGRSRAWSPRTKRPRVPRELARHGAIGGRGCTSASFGRGRCPKWRTGRQRPLISSLAGGIEHAAGRTASSPAVRRPKRPAPSRTGPAGTSAKSCMTRSPTSCPIHPRASPSSTWRPPGRARA